MTNYISDLPGWLIALFVGSFLYSISFIANTAKKAALNAGMNAKSSRKYPVRNNGFLFPLAPLCLDPFFKWPVLYQHHAT